MSTDHLSKNKRMRPGVKALIVHEKKVLIIHECVIKEGNPVEITDFPGGGIEFGENLKEALVREVKEEVGLDIKVGKVVGVWDFVLGLREHADPEKGGTHIVCIGYQCKVVGNANIDVTKNPSQEDIYDARWYTIKELLADGGKLLRHGDMNEAIRSLDI